MQSLGDIDEIGEKILDSVFSCIKGIDSAASSWWIRTPLTCIRFYGPFQGVCRELDELTADDFKPGHSGMQIPS